ncbi:MAG TPA: hypothetical protein VGN13_06350 [Solirubrobacteraceae bacterium]
MRAPALAPLALALAALALAGCETTAEKSAQLERVAKAHARAGGAGAHGLSITHPSTLVQVRASAVVHDREGTAAVVTLRNTSAHALRGVPIEIHVLDAHGASIYSNALPGLGATLTRVAVLAPHAELSWVDDQVQAAGVAASVRAVVGQAPGTAAAVPAVTIAGAHATEPAAGESGAEGSVVNRSSVTQHELIVYGLARRGAKIVAAGRSVLQQVPARGSVRFQMFFVGDARGATLALSAPATTLG